MLIAVPPPPGRNSGNRPWAAGNAAARSLYVTSAASWLIAVWPRPPARPGQNYTEYILRIILLSMYLSQDHVLRADHTADDLYQALVANGLALRHRPQREDYDRHGRFFLDSSRPRL